MKNEIVKNLFSVSDSGLKIFKMEISQHGNTWLITAPALGYMPVQHSEVEKIYDYIEKLIQTDITAGLGKKIDHIVINNMVAIKLWAEGKLTLKTFKNATETKDAIVVEMEFVGKKYKVLIKNLEEIDYKYATCDKQGKVV